MLCHNVFRRICVATIGALAVMAAVGCSGKDAPKRDPYGADVVALASDSTLFRGDVKRLEPHLDLIISGCVGLKVRDSAWTVEPSLQVWSRGKATPSKAIGKTSFDVDELSISIKEVRDEVQRLKVTIVEHGPKGYCAFGVLLEKPTPRTWSGSPKTLLRETPIKKDEATTIWGYMLGEGTGQIDGDESFEDMAKRVEWAILLKVTPTEKQSRDF